MVPTAGAHLNEATSLPRPGASGGPTPPRSESMSRPKSSDGAAMTSGRAASPAPSALARQPASRRQRAHSSESSRVVGHCLLPLLASTTATAFGKTIADLSDAAVCAAWADGKWHRLDGEARPKLQRLSRRVPFLAGEDPYFHYEDSSEINCGETHTHARRQGRGVHHRGERRGEDLFCVSFPVEPALQRVYPAAYTIRAYKMGWHGESAKTWIPQRPSRRTPCQPGMLLEREWRGISGSSTRSPAASGFQGVRRRAHRR